ncbi:MAG: endonuclease [Prevotella sp.]|nr:endonuclease [Candidatus Equicola faecalis]
MKQFFLTIIAFLSLSLVVLAQGPNGSGMYYSDANGRKASELMQAMFRIISPHTQLSYNQLWQCYKTTDRRADGKLWDIYSDMTNYEIGGPAQGANIHEEGVSYNREHVFPKSWFGGKVYPMYSDLMHVLPVDGYVNMRHSNYPFGTTNGDKYKSHNDFSKLGLCNYIYNGSQAYTGTVFEPADEYKGDVARIYFYMLTCYNDQISTWTHYDAPEFLDGSNYPGLRPWALEMLMKWAADDPVSQKEIDRNNAVYEWQNNRNPYVDYPGLEEYVWGNKKSISFSYDNYEAGGGDTPTPPTPTDTYSIVPNKALFGVSVDGLQPADVRWLDGAKEIKAVGAIGVTVNRNSSSIQMYVKDDHVRVYSGYSITITAPEGKEIVSVEFVYDKANQPTKKQSYTCSVGYYDVADYTWKGVPAESVTLTAQGKYFIKTLNVKLRDKKKHTYTSTIEIKKGSETAESDVVYVGEEQPSYSIVISEGYDQTITAITSDYAVATAEVAGNTLNVTPIGRGTAAVTVLLAENNVWSPASATIQFVVKEHPEDIQLEEPMFFSADNSELSGQSYLSDDVRFGGTYVTVNQVMKSSGFQLRNTDGCITFPMILSANGYKVVVRTTGNNHDNAVATVQIGEEEVKTCKGKNQTLEVITESTASFFSIKNTSKNALYLESIAIVPREVINVSANSYDDKTDSYYATYYNDAPFSLPEGMRGYYVTLDGEKLLLTPMFEAGDMVPAETGVLLKSSESGKLYYWASESTAESTISNSTELGTGANMLRGSVEDDYVDDGNFIYYMLSKPVGKKIGFYWGAKDGAAFINKAHKAYLPIPKTQSVALSLGFPFADAEEHDDAMAVKSAVMPVSRMEDSCIFSIVGQRLNTLRKGINIVGGKKVIFSE